ncbi:MAG: helix-turn-helix domain-containing protein [Candidatus Nanopelagicaceae bacterium]|jgi:transcriptional regulator with XRE-family HTH domain|nr:helix-turn-helix domain-containing protein [Actinomycetales bacterium]
MTATKRGVRLSPDEGAEWLRFKMEQLGISGLDELQRKSGIDKGSISRYFRQERNPGIDVIAPLCKALEVSPETLLIALGAIERKSR